MHLISARKIKTHKMRGIFLKRALLLSLIFAFIAQVTAQKEDTITHPKVYKMNYAWDIPITSVGFISNFLGLYSLRDKPSLTEEEISVLNRNDIWAFDRGATYFEPYEGNAQVISDRTMQVSIVLPALLMFDPKIRKDWPDLLLLYLEAHAISANFYTWGGPRFTNRIRPYIYNPDVPLYKKLGSGTTDSFFSGHTSTTAVSTFFMAKVFCDYHPEFSGGKKFLIYLGAAIPPAITGFFRYHAGKHFPTDILSGMAVGALCGVLIPELHRIKHNDKVRVSVLPTSNGFGLVCRF